MAGRRPKPADRSPRAPAEREAGVSSAGSLSVAWALALGVVLSTLWAFAPVRQFGFVQLDDPTYVFENPHVTSGLSAENLVWALTTGHAANWHPLTWLSLQLDVALFGVNAGAMHVVNVVIHAASALLLFFWLRRVTGATGRSAFVAAVFALHPLRVESVAWVAERKDVLGTLFWMLTLWAYVRYVARPDRVRYGLLIATFAIGLMAKPMLVTLPAVLLLIDVWPIGRTAVAQARGRRGRTTAVTHGLPGWPLWREKLPLFALSALSAATTYVAQQSGGAMSSLDQIPLGLRVENAFISYFAYLWKTIMPVDLTVFYGRPEPLPVVALAAAAIGLAAITIAALRVRESRPYLMVGWLWYIITLLPVIGLVQVGPQAMADRYTYIPLVGILIAASWGVGELVPAGTARRWLVPAACVAIVVGCAAATRTQVWAWKDNATLFARAIRLTLGGDEANAQLAVARTVMAEGRLEEALASFREAVRLRPEDGGIRYELGVALARLNRPDEALVEWREAVRLNPAQAEAQNDLGSLLASRGQIAEALEHFEAAVRAKPDFEAARLNLAVGLATTGRIAAAIRELESVLKQNPSNTRARELVTSLRGR